MIKKVFLAGTVKSIVAWSLTLAVVGLIAALLIPKKFEAKSVLLFSEPGASNRDTGRAMVSTDMQEQRQGANIMNGQIVIPTVGTKPDAVIDIMTSRAAAQEIAGRHARELFGHKPDDDDLHDFIEQIRPEVTETGQLQLQFVGDDRAVATQILGELVEFAEKRTRDLGKQFAKESIGYLETEVTRQQREVVEKGKRVKEALTRSPLTLVANSRDKYVTELISSTNLIQSTMIELQAADASLNVTLSAIKKSIKSGVQGEAYTDTTRQLKAQIMGIKARMDLASKTLSTGSPEQQRIAASFSAASKTYTDELSRVEKEAENRTLSMTLDRESLRAAMMSRLSGMRERLTNLRKDNLQLVSMQLEQRQLTNDLDRAEQQLDFAISQLAIARFAENKTYAPFVVLDPPYSPERPVFPRKGIFTLCGLAAGFFLGMFLYIRRLSNDLSKEQPNLPLAA